MACRSPLVGRVVDLVEQRHRAHDLAGLAVAALRDLLFEPGLLHRVQLAAGQVPSIVVTSPVTCRPAVNEQERTGAPSISTVQAPQAAMPQPNFGPMMPAMSRSAHKQRHVRIGVDVDRGLPLTVRRMSPQLDSQRP
jgi:hypothetical protein